MKLTPEELLDLPYNTPKGIPRRRMLKLRYLMMRWEAMKRRQGDMWPALNRGLAGARRAARLVQYLRHDPYHRALRDLVGALNERWGGFPPPDCEKQLIKARKVLSWIKYE